MLAICSDVKRGQSRGPTLDAEAKILVSIPASSRVLNISGYLLSAQIPVGLLWTSDIYQSSQPFSSSFLICMPSTPDSVGEDILLSGCPSASFIHSCVSSSGQVFLGLPRFLVNGLSNPDETYTEYSIVSSDDLIGFRRSKVTGQGHTRPSRSNLVNTISHELMKQSQWNLQGIATGPCWWAG